MFNTRIQSLNGYTATPAGCVDVVRPDGRNTVWLSQLPDGKVHLTDDRDHIEMQGMPGVSGAAVRIDAIRSMARSLGLSLSTSGALVAICDPAQVDDMISRFTQVNYQLKDQAVFSRPQ